MSKRGSWRLAVGVVGLIAACAAPPVTGGSPPRAARPTGIRASTTAGATPAPGASAGLPVAPPSSPALPIAGGNGGAIISNNGAGLIGKVKAPASLISDKGGAIVSNNGAGYRLQAAPLAQVPVPDARVVVLDAGGRPLTGPDGQPLEGRTAADGTVRFDGFVPARHAILRVELPGARGFLQAVVPAGGEARREVEVELFSTLVTTYIQERFVRLQADPQATLDKLPADVEAETRAKAAAAFAGGRVAVPVVISPARAVEAVTRLRTDDPTFDAQMEHVRELLVAAGQADMGSGRPALEVSLGQVEGVLAAPDGGLFINSAYQHRIWRLRPDGRLATLAGVGTPGAGALDGVRAADAGLDYPDMLGLDAAGRLLFVESRQAGVGRPAPDRLLRVDGDGTLRQLWEAEGIAGAVAGPADGAWAFRGGNGEPLERWEVAAGATPRRLDGYDDAAGRAVREVLGRDPLGRILAETETGIVRLDVDTRTFEPVVAIDGPVGQAGEIESATADARGHVFLGVLLQGLRVWPAGGVPLDLTFGADDPPVGMSLNDYGATLAPDGAIYVAFDQQVYRASPGKLEPVAGILNGGQVGADASDLSLGEPAGIAPAPDGAIYIADADAQRVLRVTADGKVSLVAGQDGEAPFDVGKGDGGPAAAADLFFPTSLALARDGTLFVLEELGQRLRRIAPDGTISSVFRVGSGHRLRDLAFGPDGALYAVGVVDVPDPIQPEQMWQRGKRLVRVGLEGAGAPSPAGGPANGALEVLYEEPLDSRRELMAVAVDGASRLLALRVAYAGEPPGGALVRWEAATGATELVADAALSAGHLALDATGRVLVSDPAGNRIRRFDPVTRALAIVAGPGGRVLTGDGVDDGLSLPSYLAFDAAGALYVADEDHKQVKRLAPGSF